ncbi:hypothetical protein [Haloplanus halophilus]|uniref:hypothetical protein n=1 Tax=Haloplanus halophilus TaxID=2949993 RepID=UPI00203BB7FE|nr:hypothetical protein [Haloplanus sp. GDY1]
MTVVSTLGRGAASGLAGALVWIGVSLLFLGTPDPRRAAAAGLALGVAVALATGIARRL